jgi:pyruvate dehydrogenase E1 component
MQALADASGMDTALPWRRFEPGSPAGQLCARRARQLHRDPVTRSRPVAIPASLGHPHRKPVSTQAALGRFLADLAHDVPEFGQSSGLDDAYRIHHIDTGSIVDAAMTLAGR